MKRLLLISNSTSYGRGYLDHCATEIQDFLGKVKSVAFVPFALHDLDTYTQKARLRFKALGYSLDSLHQTLDPLELLASRDAVFVGGGNTFRLLRALYDRRLLDPIRERVEQGMPYIGSSAGANIAAPDIKTTNDMPIQEPPHFAALNLVPFNINPHYLDPDPNSKLQSETREQRLIEFLEENDAQVVALREGAFLRIEWPEVLLKGTAGARIFSRREAPHDHEPISSLVLPSASLR